MTELRGLATHENLKRAFEAEAQTAHKYLYFAKIAEIEGYPDLSQLLHEMAEGGSCNAHGHLDFLRRVGDPQTDMPMGVTDSNLASAIAAEIREHNKIYPEMAEAARKEGFPDIASWFDTLAKLKQAHVERLHEAMEKVIYSSKEKDQ